MLERILVPLDGSKGSELVLAFLRLLPVDPKTSILLARVVEPGPKDPGPGFVEESVEFARAYLSEVASSLRRRGFLVETAVWTGRVAESLVSIARDEGISMIALCTHGRTARADRPFGGVAEQLLRTSPVPILAVPSISWHAQQASGDPAVSTLRSILVTTDGSRTGDAVAPMAAELAARCGSEVILLQLRPAARNGARALAGQKDAEKHLNGLKRVFERKGVSAECVTFAASPVDGIPGFAKERKVDLVAMSTRGQPRPPGSAVDSVTRAVLQQAALPVLIIRPSPAPKRAKPRRKAASSRRR